MVTGASGYIGKHLCKLLLQNGYEVYGHDIIDNAYIGTQLSSLDIRERKWCTSITFDAVIHLAALVRVNESIDKPYDYYNTNINGTVNVLNNTPCKNFIFASTGAAENPISPYALSKRVTEDIVNELCTKKQIPFTIFRFYNVIGTDGVPPTNPDGLFYNLLQSERTGQFKVFGHDYNTPDGTPIRDYVHVMDICRSIMLAIEKPANDLENLGTGIGHTVKEIASAFFRVNGINCNIEYLPRRSGDAERTVLDNVSNYMIQSYTLDDLVKK